MIKFIFYTKPYLYVLEEKLNQMEREGYRLERVVFFFFFIFKEKKRNFKEASYYVSPRDSTGNTSADLAVMFFENRLIAQYHAIRISRWISDLHIFRICSPIDCSVKREGELCRLKMVLLNIKISLPIFWFSSGVASISLYFSLMQNRGVADDMIMIVYYIIVSAFALVYNLEAALMIFYHDSKNRWRRGELY